MRVFAQLFAYHQASHLSFLNFGPKTRPGIDPTLEKIVDPGGSGSETLLDNIKQEGFL